MSAPLPPTTTTETRVTSNAAIGVRLSTNTLEKKPVIVVEKGVVDQKEKKEKSVFLLAPPPTTSMETRVMSNATLPHLTTTTGVRLSTNTLEKKPVIVVEKGVVDQKEKKEKPLQQQQQQPPLLLKNCNKSSKKNSTTTTLSNLISQNAFQIQIPLSTASSSLVLLSNEEKNTTAVVNNECDMVHEEEKEKTPRHKRSREALPPVINIKRRALDTGGYVPKVENIPTDLYSELKGDSTSAQCFRKELQNRASGVPYFDQQLAQNWSHQIGTLVRNPHADELLQLRPPLKSDSIDALGLSTNQKPLIFGVSDIIHVAAVRDISPNSSQREYINELWLLGVMNNGVSVALEIKDFQASFLLMRKRRPGLTEDEDDVEQSRDWLQPECQELLVSLNFPQHSSEELAQLNPTEIKKQLTNGFWAVRVEPEIRTPLVGFTNMRKDKMVRVYCRNLGIMKRTAANAKRLGYRIFHENWSLEQQFFHQSVFRTEYDFDKSASSNYAQVREKRSKLDDAVYSGIKINSWIQIERRELLMTDVFEQRKTQCQLEGKLKQWRTIICCPENTEPLPCLIGSVDIETISEQWYRTGKDTFPLATNRNDPIICIAMSFYVFTLGTQGSFVRVGLVLKTAEPIPDCIVYSFDTEADLLRAFFLLCGIRNDLCGVSGYNILDYDIPYILERVNTLKGENDVSEFMKGMSRFKAAPAELKTNFEAATTTKQQAVEAAERCDTDSDSDDDDDEEEPEKIEKGTLRNLDYYFQDHQEGRQQQQQHKTRSIATENNSNTKKKAVPKIVKRAVLLGRWQFDLYKVIPGYHDKKLPDYKLKTVMQNMLPGKLHKIDCDYDTLAPNFYGSERARTFNLFYCIIDSLLPQMLDHHCSLGSYFLTMASKCNTGFMDLIKRGEQIRVYNSFLEEIHCQEWYLNLDLLKRNHKEVFYTEVVPDDWNGWSENNRIHQFLAKKYYCGLVEPPVGFFAEDSAQNEYARYKEDQWLETLVSNRKMGEEQIPHSPNHISITDRTREEQLKIFQTLMYGDRKTNKKTRRYLTELAAPVKLEAAAAVTAKVSQKRKRTEEETDCGGGGGGAAQTTTAKKKQMTLDLFSNAAKKVVSMMPEIIIPPQQNERLAERRGPNPAVLKPGCQTTWTEQEELSMIEELRKGVPRKFYSNQDACLSESFSCGGLVLPTAKGGWYDDEPNVLDFQSLYPSIIEADLICYSTALLKDEKGGARFFNLPGIHYKKVATPPLRKELKQNKMAQGLFYFSVVPDPYKLSVEELRQLASEKKTRRENPTPHIRYMVPRVVNRLVAGRSVAKQKKATCAKIGDKLGVSKYENQQRCLKVLCNAAYGFLNVDPEKAYLACPPLAYQICAIGRDHIRIIKILAEEMGATVIGGDTDSIFLTFLKLKDRLPLVQHETPEQNYQRRTALHVQLCDSICKKANSFFLEPHNLQNENRTLCAHFVKQKCYSFIKASDGKTVKKGSGSVKRNYPKATRDMLDRVTEQILLKQIGLARQTVLEYVEKLVRTTKQEPGGYSLEELSMSAAFNPNTMVVTEGKKMLAQPKMFLRIIERTNTQFQSGERIRYICIGDQDLEALSYAQSANLKPHIPSYFKACQIHVQGLLDPFLDCTAFFNELAVIMNGGGTEKIKITDCSKKTAKVSSISRRRLSVSVIEDNTTTRKKPKTL